jgi:REP element-mobilizing transposase RayT
MADTYTQLYIHFVFAVQNRRSLIQPDWETKLYRYITGIVQNKSHKMININGMPDHLHMFIGFQPVDHMSELIKVVKGESSKWIKDNGLVRGNFRWQEGYGAFSYSRSHIDRVYHYIQRQKEHHKKKTFRDEYIELLKSYGVDYDDRYIFKPFED